MQPRSQQLFGYAKKAVYSVAPIGNAFYDLSVMAMGAKDYAEKTYDSPIARAFFVVPVSIFAFIQSIGLNFETTVLGIDETVTTLNERKIPSKWVRLSRQKERLAIIIGVVFALLVSAGDFCGGYWFVDEAPEDYAIEADVNLHYWKILSIVTGLVAMVTTAFTEGFETYQCARNLIARDKTPYTATWSALVLGYPIVLLAALEAAGETYAGVKNTVPYSTTAVLQWVLLAPSIAKIGTDFFFPGRLTLSAIDDFVIEMHDTVQKNYEEYTNARALLANLWAARTEVGAFLGTTVAAVWVEYSQLALTDDLLVNDNTKLPFDVPANLRSALGWSVTLRDGILQMATLYPVFFYLAQKLLRDQPHAVHDLELGTPHAALTPTHVDDDEKFGPGSPLIRIRRAPPHESFAKNTLTFWRLQKAHEELGIKPSPVALLNAMAPRYGTFLKSHY